MSSFFSLKKQCMCFTTRTSRLALLPVSRKTPLTRPIKSQHTNRQSDLLRKYRRVLWQKFQGLHANVYFGQWKINLSPTGELLEDVRVVLVKMLLGIGRNYYYKGLTLLPDTNRLSECEDSIRKYRGDGQPIRRATPLRSVIVDEWGWRDSESKNI